MILLSLTPWTKRIIASAALTLGATLAVSACSSHDTIVALTIMSANEVGNPDVMHVTFTQAGEAPFTTDITPPHMQTDAGPVVQSSFFERIPLPGGWPSGEATIEVSVTVAGKTITGQTTADVMENKTVAAWLTLGMNMPVMPPHDMNDAGPRDASL